MKQRIELKEAGALTSQIAQAQIACVQTLLSTARESQGGTCIRLGSQWTVKSKVCTQAKAQMNTGKESTDTRTVKKTVTVKYSNKQSSDCKDTT